MRTTYVLSYPGSGRTWLEFMLGAALRVRFELDVPLGYLWNVYKLHQADARVPLVWFSHDDQPYHVPIAKMSPSKEKYADNNVVLIGRDPRDAITSCYFKHTRRPQFFVYGSMERFTGSLSEYLRDERFGIEGLVAWLNIWAAQRNVPREFILIRYEDLHKDAAGELQRLIKLLDVDIVQTTITAAVKFASFKNLRRMETEQLLGPKSILQVARLGDPESHRIRRGKVGGFIDYFTEEDVVFANQVVAKLSPFFGYTTT